MERITYDEATAWHRTEGEEKEDFLAWAMMALVAQKKVETRPERYFEVELRIDGEVYSLRKLLDRLHAEHQHMVESHARQLVEEKFGKLEEAIADTTGALRRAIKDKMKDALPTLNWEDD